MSPAQIGEFEVLSRIGGGGMADVYRCRRRGIGGFEKILAVKRIRSERASDPEFVSMFLDEARLAANLNHPNIVQMFEMGEADGAPFIAMEYVPGPTLARLMRKTRRDKRSELRHVAGHVAKILADVCEGLHHAHTATGPDGELVGLVHGDVSPQNIIVTRQGLPKLLDFGVAKASSRASEVRADNLKGKLKYMAPEQLMGKVDHRSDLFAIGVCLFEATVGRTPYGADDVDQDTLFTNITEGRFLRPSDLVAFYPRALEEIILAAIEPDLSGALPVGPGVARPPRGFRGQRPLSLSRARRGGLGERPFSRGRRVDPSDHAAPPERGTDRGSGTPRVIDAGVARAALAHGQGGSLQALRGIAGHLHPEPPFPPGRRLAGRSRHRRGGRGRRRGSGSQRREHTCGVGPRR